MEWFNSAWHSLLQGSPVEHGKPWKRIPAQGPWHTPGGILGFKRAKKKWESPHWKHPGSGEEQNPLIFLQREQLKFRGMAWLSNSQLIFPGKVCSLKNFKGSLARKTFLAEWKRQEKGGKGIARMCCGHQRDPGHYSHHQIQKLGHIPGVPSHSHHPSQPFLSQASVSHFSVPRAVTGCISLGCGSPLPQQEKISICCRIGISLAQTQNSSWNLQVHDVTVPKVS